MPQLRLLPLLCSIALSFAAAPARAQSTIDATDKFAYGANTGWVNLGSGFLNTDLILCPDTDGDGMGDAWEMQRFGRLAAAGPGTDADKDLQTDAADSCPAA